MPVEPSREELEAAHCWEADDHIASSPAMTAFRRRTRYQQARWREAHGHPIGTQPIVPRRNVAVRPVGNRVPLEYGRTTGAGFVSPAALAAARARTSYVEREQSFDHQRLWADLLSSEALGFNLFGDLGADLRLADRAVHRWWPDAPGAVREIRFAHSPGRLDRSYLNSLRDFDAAFVLVAGGGSRAVVAVDVKLFERNKGEQVKSSNAARVMEVCERSDVFTPEVRRLLGRTDLAVLWLEHLLLLSMLQHESREWAWGRYVVVHPADNADVVDLLARYRSYLADDSTFASMTLEDLFASRALPAATTRALRARYGPG